MEKMGLKYVIFGTLTYVLLAGLLYGINTCVKQTKDEQVLIYGLAGAAAASTIAIYLFVWAWSNVKALWFYAAFIPLLLSTFFDNLTTLDLWREPNGVFLSVYVGAKDRHVHNIVATNLIAFNGIVLMPLNFVVLWRLGNGKISRSLLLIPAAAYFLMYLVYAFCATTSGLPLHPMSKCLLWIMPLWTVLFPFLILRIPRGFVLSHKQGSGILAKLLALITLPSLIAAGAVILAKALVLNGVSHELLDIVRVNDPLIFLNDVEKTFPFIAAVIWQNVLMSLPILIVSFIYHLKSQKPTLLWELSLVNLTLTCGNQWVFIVGNLYWKTPKNLRVNPTNTTFLMINLVPVVATLLQVISLLPLRVPVVPTKVSQKKRV